MDLNNLSKDQVEAIKAAGGFSGSELGGVTLGTDPQSFEPKASIPISGYGKGLRPRMSSHGDSLIMGPSADLPKKLARQAEQQWKERAEEVQKVKEDPLTPHNLRKDVETLRRQIKRLEKRLKEVEGKETT